jgi:hypothetical protein
MLFVTLLKTRAGTSKERIARRLEWQYPAGMQLVAEYWLQTPDPNVIVVAEADSIASMMAATSAWDDVHDITVIPAVTAEEGMAIARQAMAK